MVRTERGTFDRKFDESKKLRSIKLTDTAWDNLEKIALASGISRTDVIEQWTREEATKQQIFLEAINTFIEDQRRHHKANSNQFKKEFSLDTRDWRKFREFKELAETWFLI